jgi:FkbM family methyltransferase
MRPSFRRWLTASASSLGYEVTPHWQIDAAPQARYLAKLFDFLRVDCVIDVGANRGQYHDFLRRDVGYAGWVISFEPVPTLGKHLAERATADPRWLVQPVALGATPGTATLNVMASDTFSSFLAPNAAGTAMFATRNRVAEQAEVPVHTLDELLPGLLARTSCSRPYLKLDTQGYDLAVIEGATASLPAILALQTEASVTPIYEGAPDFARVIRHLEARSFALSGMFPNNPDHFPRMIEFDCHMVNNSQVGAGPLG